MYTPTDSAGSAHTFEQYVAWHLSALTSKFNSKIFTNLIVPYDNKTAEIDCVVLLPDGLLVVECKDYGGVVFCNEDANRDWVVWYNKDTSFKLYSPVQQNATHIRLLCQALSFEPQRCVSLVVFSDRADLRDVPKDTLRTIVCHVSELFNMVIDVDEQAVLSQEQLSQLEGVLMQFSQADDGQRDSHTEYVHAVQDGSVCPVCGHLLKVRYRRTDHHRFYGCTMYPMCTYTRDIQD